MQSCDIEAPAGSTAATPAARLRTGAPHRTRPGAPPKLTVHWARTPGEVRAAQRLRHAVFAREMGARLPAATGAPSGLDVDRFDAYCDHLLVRAGSPLDGEGAPVVGTYRVLAPERAVAAGGYYSESEFDLAPLAALRPRAVELGRSCVHPEWRTGGVILAMWSALAEYMVARQVDTMFGCASYSLAAGAEPAVALWHALRGSHLVDSPWRVQPLHPLPHVADTTVPADREAGARALAAAPLLKGYLRCGARLLGPPALDEAFNTADFPILLRLGDMAPRYRTHFLGGG